MLYGKIMTNLQKWVKSFFILFLILAAVFIAYAEALNNGFITWDTGVLVLDNDHIKAFTWENIQWMLTAFDKSYWQPLTWLSHALTYSIFGLDPWGQHLVNIIVHGLNTVLLFVLVIVLMSFKTESRSGFVAINNKILLSAGIPLDSTSN